MQKAFSHRNKSMQNHLCKVGTDPAAQAQFLEVYPHAVEIARNVTESLRDTEGKGTRHMVACACEHGHHRSVAFAELVKEDCRRVFPNLEIRCLHFDLTDAVHFNRWWNKDFASFDDFITPGFDRLIRERWAWSAQQRAVPPPNSTPIRERER